MRHIVVVIVMLFLLAICSQASDTTTSWNLRASLWHFGTYPQAATATFEDAYSGSNFAAEFAALKHALAADLDTTLPPWGEDDLVNASLESWP